MVIDSDVHFRNITLADGEDGLGGEKLETETKQEGNRKGQV